MSFAASLLLPALALSGVAEDPFLAERTPQFDPWAAADEIPELVPRPLIVESLPADGRILRGDWETPDRVVLVVNEFWPRTTMALADQVLQSGTKVTLLSEFETPRRDTAKVFQTLARTHGERVEQLPIEVDSAWVRDWGPLQLSSPHRPLWLDAGYDDDERVRDDVAPAAMGEQLGAEVRAFDWPLDGGAFISNGAGLCVMTLEYLELEGICSEDDDLQQMLANLGCRATAVVPTLPMEDTKHADMIAQFISPTRVLVAQIEADDDIEGSWEESLRLDTAARGIALAAQRLDMDLEIVRVPTPASVDGPVFSFVNGLHLGDRYLMPSYTKVDAARESAAASVIASALGGDKPVVSVDASLPLDSGGALHCLALGVFLN